MSRPPSDIDPRRFVLEPKERWGRRRRRNAPDPSPQLKAGEKKALDRVMARPINPGVMQEPRKGGGWKLTSPHSDLDLWELQLADAFGTRSQSVMTVFLRDLKAIARRVWDEDVNAWKVHEDDLNAALAMVADIKPRNVTEAALAAQMVNVHWMQKRLARDALNNGGMVLEQSASLASKLARTYAIQLETLRMLKGGKKPTKQTIIVKRENHVHYHDHRDRGAGKTGAHSDAPAIDGGTIRGGTGQPEERAALPSPEETGRVVPISSRPRKAGV